MRHSITCLSLISILVLNSNFADATTYYRSSPTTIVGSAEHILIGQVTKLSKDKKQIEIKVIEELKGKLEKDIISLPVYNQRYYSFWTSYEPEQLYLLFLQKPNGNLDLVSDINITSTSAVAPPISIQLGTCRPISGLNDPAVYMVREILIKLEPQKEDPTKGLIPLLSSVNHDEKLMAISQLLKMDNPRAKEELEKLFPDDNELNSAIYSTDKKDKLRFLSSVAKSNNPKIREAAISKLCWLGENALPLLRGAVADGNANIRLSAIKQIGDLRKPEDAILVAQGLKDPEFTVRDATAVALVKIKSEKSIPFLIDALKSNGDEYLCLLYVEVIEGIMADDAPSTLMEILQSDVSVQADSACIRVLGRLKAKSAIPLLIKMLNNKQKCGTSSKGDILISDRVREALTLITERVTPYSLNVTEQERESAIKDWKDWWEQSKTQIESQFKIRKFSFR